MSTITSRPRRVKTSTLPLDAVLTLTIRGTRYVLTAIDPGPDNSRAWRLEKTSGKNEIYDVARTNDGLIVCDCPSYVSTHEGTCSTCKHGSALVMVGLLDSPAHVPAAETIPPVKARVDLAGTGRNTSPPSEAQSTAAKAIPAPAVPAWDPLPYHLADLVSRGEASWINAGPKGGPTPPCWTTGPAKAPCCPLEDPSPCAACTVHPEPDAAPGPSQEAQGERAEWSADFNRRQQEGQIAADDAGWDDAHVWQLGPDLEPIHVDEEPVAKPAPSTLWGWLEMQASHHRRIGGAKHTWLAGKIAGLAEQARFLEARTPEQFDDRLAAHADAIECGFGAQEDADDSWRDTDEYPW